MVEMNHEAQLMMMIERYICVVIKGDLKSNYDVEQILFYSFLSFFYFLLLFMWMVSEHDDKIYMRMRS